MLNKWTKMRAEEERGDNEPLHARRRPFLSSQCMHLHDAEKFRRDILREISDGIRQIQNAGMGEHAIRDLNDQINKLIREKWHWNNRIKELKGPDYNKIERKQSHAEGDMQTQGGLGLKGSGGYRYFGAAKDLPGVKELFARQASKITKRKRGDVYKYITPDYYGLRDEEDGVLLELEEKACEVRRAKLEKERAEYRRQCLSENGRTLDDDSDEEEEGIGIGGVTGAVDAIAAHVAVPTQEIVAKTVLEQKKRELLQRLTT